MIRSFLDSNPQWLHQPKEFKIDGGSLKITTEPRTDYWQKTYYGFQFDKAPILYVELAEDFTIECKQSCKFNKLFDQCGIMLYQNTENWFKVGLEYENEKIARLGSVVTNFGYSDWATTDVPASVNEFHLRISRRGQDFLFEHSLDGQDYQQMRVLHMHEQIIKARIGLYACSPTDSSFVAEFINPVIKQSIWQPFQFPTN